MGLHSDLLLHDMGPDLADGLPQGEAGGTDWRTTPLWGLGNRTRLLHDARARTLEAARHRLAQNGVVFDQEDSHRLRGITNGTGQRAVRSRMG